MNQSKISAHPLVLENLLDLYPVLLWLLWGSRFDKIQQIRSLAILSKDSEIGERIGGVKPLGLRGYDFSNSN